MQFNKQQEMAVNTLDGNICVIAAAGSGKTTVLTHRIKNIIEKNNCPSSSVLAVTFSKKAKNNIVEKLEKLNIKSASVETFHSLALKIIISAYGANKFKVWTAAWEKEKFIKDICQALNLCLPDDVPYNDICSFIALQKVNMKKPSDILVYPNNMPFKQKYMSKIYMMYEKEKEKKDYIEFDDFLNIANNVFDTMPHILECYQQKFQYILADEFQDVSPSQALLLKKININNTMIVGDPLQAIYAFRGGHSKYIMDFDKKYKDTKIINLSTNYRCSADIVNTANRLASSIPDSQHKNYVESNAFNGKYKIPELRHFTDEDEESIWITEKILQLKEKYNYDSIAILTRTNAQLQNFETCFHNSNVPFDIVDGKLFTDLPEIKLVISYLQLALDEDNDEAFRYLYNKPNRWLSKKFLEETENNATQKNVSLYKSMFTIGRRNWRFKNGIDEIFEVTNNLQNKKYETVAEMVSYLRKRLNIDKFVAKGKQADDGGYTEQTDNLDSFENMCSKYTSIDSLIYYLDSLNKEVVNSSKEKVKLLTIHKAKGMEYPVVFIPGCNEGLLPHYKSNNSNDECRLFYVAITRTEKELYMSYVDMYNNKASSVSPFIESIKDTINIIKTNCKKLTGKQKGE